MSFLAPLWLALAAAAAVPLLLHLLRRRIGTRLEFPAVRYLQRAEQEHSRSLRLRNLLLMVLRVAIVLAVALAAARPVARIAGGGHAATALALVLDNSLSTTVVMNGAPLLARLRDDARAVFAQASVNDRLVLVTADGRMRGGSARALAEEASRVAPLSGAGDLSGAVGRALSAVRALGEDAREVVVLTDGQRSAWRSAIDAGETPVVVAPHRGAPPANRAALLAEPRPARWTPRGAIALRVASADSVTFRVSIDGALLVRGTAAPDEQVLINAAPASRGWVGGDVELEPDELPGDDVRYFALWIGPAPRVAVAPGAGAFLRDGVAVLRAAGRIADGDDAHVVAGDELAALPALIIAPADPVRLGAANRALARASVPWRFGVVRRGAAAAAPATRFPDVGVALRYALVPQPGAEADTLATVAGEPWIVAGPGYVLVGSPLDPAATSLPIRAAFVPWLGEMLTERLAGEAGGVIAAAPGAPFARPRWADALSSATGGRSSLGASAVAPARPGVYFLERAGRRVGALVVNPEPAESDLTRASDRELADRVRAGAVRITADDSASTVAFRAPARRSLLQPLLIAGLLLLVVEALVTSADRRAAA